MVGQRNLAPKRGPSVWNRGGERPALDAPRARWLKGVGGAAIALTGAALAAVGGTMVYRASVPRRSDQAAAGLDEAPRTPPGGDIVSDESAASFPASDAPSWTPTVGPIADHTSGR